MHFEYYLTKEDVVNFNFYVGWLSPEKKNYRIKYHCTVFIGALAGGFFIYIQQNPEDKLVFFLILGIVALIMTVLMSYLSINVNYKNKLLKYASDPNNSSWYSQTSLMMSDERIITMNGTGESVFNWNSINRKVETTDYLYLFITSAQAVIIPKRILDQKQLQELKTMMSRNLSLKSEFDPFIANKI